MRIVYLSPVASFGGAERVLMDLLMQVRAARPTWALSVCVPGEGPLTDRLRRLGVDVVSVVMPPRVREVGVYAGGAASIGGAVSAIWGYARQLRRTLRAIDPDIVHSNGLKMHVMAAWVRPSRARVVWHLHDYVGRRGTAGQLLRRSAGRVHVVIANSMSVADDATRMLGRRTRPQAILNGVDVATFTPDGASTDLDARAGLAPAPAGTVRVGLVATYARWKGHITFLEALAMLPAAVPVRAYVVGGAIYETPGSQYTRTELEAQVSRLGLTGRVGFIDFVDQPAPVYRALDVVVHASTEPEPFGLVVAEAMACGRAVIASRAGGVEEVVRHGVDGLTHAAGDASELASGLTRLAGDASFRQRLGAEARQSAERYLTTARMGREFIEVYQRLAPAQVIGGAA